MRFLRLIAALGLVTGLLGFGVAGAPKPARADEPSATQLELSFVPTGRVQMVVWVERVSGEQRDTREFMGTLGLTSGVATAGIGNRPGASQMNSGYRWPYGRREGVLPVWAHRRAQAPNAKQFKRVIFQNRTSEGLASRTSNDQSVDEYYCLSFDRETTGKEALDAVTCASVFSSDKGRFITSRDVNGGYAEPFEATPKIGSMRELGLTSLYPPRRNVERCKSSGCYDHADVASFRSHAQNVMPELDAVSRATPAGERATRWLAPIPADWDSHANYELMIEVNVEGDYNSAFSAATLPTPKQPMGRWDSWATGYGYPFRGQPSVVYAIAFRLDTVSQADTVEPVGYGSINGEDGDLRPMAQPMITDDPGGTPGSGADRLRLIDGVRASLQVTQGNPCELPVPPVQCGMSCKDDPEVCGELVCARDGTCQSICVATKPPARVPALDVSRHPDRQRSHMWARLSFEVPESDRPINSFEVRVRPKGGMWDQAYTHDAAQELLPVALDVCVDPEDPARNLCANLKAGDEFSGIDLTGLMPQTDYEVSVAARDAKCNELGKPALATFSTPAREFTTVSPCFVATAAYGSPLAAEISVLRAVRDRYLASHSAGRALIDLYYRVGPSLAEQVQSHPWLKQLTRTLLSPLVAAARWWLS